jgi:hypothetical protein
MNRIETFRELMGEIAYSWDHDYKLERHVEDGVVTFTLNKLTITQSEASYKLDRWKLAPGVFEKLEQFYKLLG